MFSPDELIFLVPDTALPTHTEGGFARRILVVIAAEPEAPDTRPFLTKILAAANLHLQQDALLAEIPEGAPVALLSILKAKQPTHVLVFGLQPEALGLALQTSLYQPFHFYNTSFLFAEKLSLLEPDKTRKGQLWRALQAMFL